MKTKLLIIDVSCSSILANEEYGCYRFVTFDDQSEHLLNNYISTYDEDSVDGNPVACVVHGNQGALVAGFDITEDALNGLMLIFDVSHTVVFDNNMIDKCREEGVGYSEIISRYCDLTDFFSEE